MEKNINNIIETERLILRQVTENDVDGMFELDSDPEVHRYLGNKPLTSIEQSQAVIKLIQEQYTTLGIGRWAVIEKASGNFIGWSGLKLNTQVVNNHQYFHDIGYRFIKRFWGKGYATESALAWLTYGFNTLKLEFIYGMADIDNTSSNNVLTKLGLEFIEEFDYDGIRHNWYKLSREQYK